MKVSDLAEEIGCAPSHVRRLAKAGIVPGTLTTGGGHYRFKKTEALADWISGMQADSEFRARTLARAYATYRDKSRKRRKNVRRSLVDASALIWDLWETQGMLNRLLRDRRQASLDEETKRRLAEALEPFVDAFEKLVQEIPEEHETEEPE